MTMENNSIIHLKIIPPIVGEFKPSASASFAQYLLCELIKKNTEENVDATVKILHNTRESGEHVEIARKRLIDKRILEECLEIARRGLCFLHFYNEIVKKRTNEYPLSNELQSLLSTYLRMDIRFAKYQKSNGSSQNMGGLLLLLSDMSLTEAVGVIRNERKHMSNTYFEKIKVVFDGTEEAGKIRKKLKKKIRKSRDPTKLTSFFLEDHDLDIPTISHPLEGDTRRCEQISVPTSSEVIEDQFDRILNTIKDRSSCITIDDSDDFLVQKPYLYDNNLSQITSKKSIKVWKKQKWKEANDTPGNLLNNSAMTKKLLEVQIDSFKVQNRHAAENKSDSDYWSQVGSPKSGNDEEDHARRKNARHHDLTSDLRNLTLHKNVYTDFNTNTVPTQVQVQPTIDRIPPPSAVLQHSAPIKTEEIDEAPASSANLFNEPPALFNFLAGSKKEEEEECTKKETDGADLTADLLPVNSEQHNTVSSTMYDDISSDEMNLPSCDEDQVLSARRSTAGIPPPPPPPPAASEERDSQAINLRAILNDTDSTYDVAGGRNSTQESDGRCVAQMQRDDSKAKPQVQFFKSSFSSAEASQHTSGGFLKPAAAAASSSDSAAASSAKRSSFTYEEAKGNDDNATSDLLAVSAIEEEEESISARFVRLNIAKIIEERAKSDNRHKEINQLPRLCVGKTDSSADVLQVADVTLQRKDMESSGADTSSKEPADAGLTAEPSNNQKSYACETSDANADILQVANDPTLRENERSCGVAAAELDQSSRKPADADLKAETSHGTVKCRINEGPEEEIRVGAARQDGDLSSDFSVVDKVVSCVALQQETNIRAENGCSSTEEMQPEVEDVNVVESINCDTSKDLCSQSARDECAPPPLSSAEETSLIDADGGATQEEHQSETRQEFNNIENMDTDAFLNEIDKEFVTESTEETKRSNVELPSADIDNTAHEVPHVVEENFETVDAENFSVVEQAAVEENKAEVALIEQPKETACDLKQTSSENQELCVSSKVDDALLFEETSLLATEQEPVASSECKDSTSDQELISSTVCETSIEQVPVSLVDQDLVTSVECKSSNADSSNSDKKDDNHEALIELASPSITFGKNISEESVTTDIVDESHTPEINQTLQQVDQKSAIIEEDQALQNACSVDEQQNAVEVKTADEPYSVTEAKKEIAKAADENSSITEVEDESSILPPTKLIEEKPNAVNLENTVTKEENTSLVTLTETVTDKGYLPANKTFDANEEETANKIQSFHACNEVISTDKSAETLHELDADAKQLENTILKTNADSPECYEDDLTEANSIIGEVIVGGVETTAQCSDAIPLLQMPYVASNDDESKKSTSNNAVEEHHPYVAPVLLPDVKESTPKSKNKRSPKAGKEEKKRNAKERIIKSQNPITKSKIKLEEWPSNRSKTTKNKSVKTNMSSSKSMKLKGVDSKDHATDLNKTSEKQKNNSKLLKDKQKKEITVKTAKKLNSNVFTTMPPSKKKPVNDDERKVTRPTKRKMKKQLPKQKLRPTFKTRSSKSASKETALRKSKMEFALESVTLYTEELNKRAVISKTISNAKCINAAPIENNGLNILCEAALMTDPLVSDQTVPSCFEKITKETEASSETLISCNKEFASAYPSPSSSQDKDFHVMHNLRLRKNLHIGSNTAFYRSEEDIGDCSDHSEPPLVIDEESEHSVDQVHEKIVEVQIEKSKNRVTENDMEIKEQVVFSPFFRNMQEDLNYPNAASNVVVVAKSDNYSTEQSGVVPNVTTDQWNQQPTAVSSYLSTYDMKYYNPCSDLEISEVSITATDAYYPNLQPGAIDGLEISSSSSSKPPIYKPAFHGSLERSLFNKTNADLLTVHQNSIDLSNKKDDTEFALEKNNSKTTAEQNVPKDVQKFVDGAALDLVITTSKKNRKNRKSSLTDNKSLPVAADLPLTKEPKIKSNQKARKNVEAIADKLKLNKSVHELPPKDKNKRAALTSEDKNKKTVLITEDKNKKAALITEDKKNRKQNLKTQKKKFLKIPENETCSSSSDDVPLQKLAQSMKNGKRERKPSNKNVTFSPIEEQIIIIKDPKKQDKKLTDVNGAQKESETVYISKKKIAALGDLTDVLKNSKPEKKAPGRPKGKPRSSRRLSTTDPLLDYKIENEENLKKNEEIPEVKKLEEKKSSADSQFDELIKNDKNKLKKTYVVSEVKNSQNEEDVEVGSRRKKNRRPRKCVPSVTDIETTQDSTPYEETVLEFKSGSKENVEMFKQSTDILPKTDNSNRFSKISEELTKSVIKENKQRSASKRKERRLSAEVSKASKSTSERVLRSTSTITLLKCSVEIPLASISAEKIEQIMNCSENTVLHKRSVTALHSSETLLESKCVLNEQSTDLLEKNSKCVENDSLERENRTSITVEKSTPAVEETSIIVVKSTPAVEKSTPAVEETSPAVEKTSRAVEETSPAVEKTSPAVEKTSPAVEEISPAVEEISSAVEEASLAVEETSITVEKSSPAVEETPLAVEETSSAVEKCSTEVEDTFITVEQISPAIEETSIIIGKTSPAVEEISPAVEKTTPVVEETSPSVEKISTAVEKCSTEVEDTSITVEQISPAIEETSPPVKETSIRVGKTSPAVEEISPVVEKTTPVVEEISPAVKETSISVEKMSPVVEEISPAVKETSISVEKMSPAVEETSVTVEKTSISVEKTSPAVEETSITGEETSISVEETVITVEETCATVEETCTATVEETCTATVEETCTATVEETCTATVEETCTATVEETCTATVEETCTTIEATSTAVKEANSYIPSAASSIDKDQMEENVENGEDTLCEELLLKEKKVDVEENYLTETKAVTVEEFNAPSTIAENDNTTEDDEKSLEVLLEKNDLQIRTLEEPVTEGHSSVLNIIEQENLSPEILQNVAPIIESIITEKEPTVIVNHNDENPDCFEEHISSTEKVDDNYSTIVLSPVLSKNDYDDEETQKSYLPTDRIQNSENIVEKSAVVAAESEKVVIKHSIESILGENNLPSTEPKVSVIEQEKVSSFYLEPSAYIRPQKKIESKIEKPHSKLFPERLSRKKCSKKLKNVTNYLYSENSETSSNSSDDISLQLLKQTIEASGIKPYSAKIVNNVKNNELKKRRLSEDQNQGIVPSKRKNRRYSAPGSSPKDTFSKTTKQTVIPIPAVAPKIQRLVVDLSIRNELCIQSCINKTKLFKDAGFIKRSKPTTEIQSSADKPLTGKPSKRSKQAVANEINEEIDFGKILEEPQAESFTKNTPQVTAFDSVVETNISKPITETQPCVDKPFTNEPFFNNSATNALNSFAKHQDNMSPTCRTAEELINKLFSFPSSTKVESDSYNSCDDVLMENQHEEAVPVVADITPDLSTTVSPPPEEFNTTSNKNISMENVNESHCSLESFEVLEVVATENVCENSADVNSKKESETVLQENSLPIHEPVCITEEYLPQTVTDANDAIDAAAEKMDHSKLTDNLDTFIESQSTDVMETETDISVTSYSTVHSSLDSANVQDASLDLSSSTVNETTEEIPIATFCAEETGIHTEIEDTLEFQSDPYPAEHQANMLTQSPRHMHDAESSVIQSKSPAWNANYDISPVLQPAVETVTDESTVQNFNSETVHFSDQQISENVERYEQVCDESPCKTNSEIDHLLKSVNNLIEKSLLTEIMDPSAKVIDKEQVSSSEISIEKSNKMPEAEECMHVQQETVLSSGEALIETQNLNTIETIPQKVESIVPSVDQANVLNFFNEPEVIVDSSSNSCPAEAPSPLPVPPQFKIPSNSKEEKRPKQKSSKRKRVKNVVCTTKTLSQNEIPSVDDSSENHTKIPSLVELATRNLPKEDANLNLPENTASERTINQYELNLNSEIDCFSQFQSYGDVPFDALKIEQNDDIENTDNLEETTDFCSGSSFENNQMDGKSSSSNRLDASIENSNSYYSMEENEDMPFGNHYTFDANLIDYPSTSNGINRKDQNYPHSVYRNPLEMHNWTEGIENNFDLTSNIVESEKVIEFTPKIEVNTETASCSEFTESTDILTVDNNIWESMINKSPSKLTANTQREEITQTADHYTETINPYLNGIDYGIENNSETPQICVDYTKFGDPLISGSNGSTNEPLQQNSRLMEPYGYGVDQEFNINTLLCIDEVIESFPWCELVQSNGTDENNIVYETVVNDAATISGDSYNENITSFEAPYNVTSMYHNLNSNHQTNIETDPLLESPRKVAATSNSDDQYTETASFEPPDNELVLSDNSNANQTNIETGHLSESSKKSKNSSASSTSSSSSYVYDFIKNIEESKSNTKESNEKPKQHIGVRLNSRTRPPTSTKRNALPNELLKSDSTSKTTSHKHKSKKSPTLSNDNNSMPKILSDDEDVHLDNVQYDEANSNQKSPVPDHFELQMPVLEDARLPPKGNISVKPFAKEGSSGGKYLNISEEKSCINLEGYVKGDVSSRSSPNSRKRSKSRSKSVEVAEKKLKTTANPELDKQKNENVAGSSSKLTVKPIISETLQTMPILKAEGVPNADFLFEQLKQKDKEKKLSNANSKPPIKKEERSKIIETCFKNALEDDTSDRKNKIDCSPARTIDKCPKASEQEDKKSIKHEAKSPFIKSSTDNSSFVDKPPSVVPKQPLHRFEEALNMTPKDRTSAYHKRKTHSPSPSPVCDKRLKLNACMEHQDKRKEEKDRLKTPEPFSSALRERKDRESKPTPKEPPNRHSSQSERVARQEKFTDHTTKQPASKDKYLPYASYNSPEKLKRVEPSYSRTDAYCHASSSRNYDKNKRNLCYDSSYVKSRIPETQEKRRSDRNKPLFEPPFTSTPNAAGSAYVPQSHGWQPSKMDHRRYEDIRKRQWGDERANRNMMGHNAAERDRSHHKPNSNEPRGQKNPGGSANTNEFFAIKNRELLDRLNMPNVQF